MELRAVEPEAVELEAVELQAASKAGAKSVTRSSFPGVAPSAMLPLMDNRSFSDVGGTPGGLGQFLLGFAMACIGGFLISNQVMVVGSYWAFWGGSTFGITLLPMLFGIGILFWNGKSVIGWLLTAAGALFIFAGIIANMHIYFQPSSLFHTMVMLILLVGGLALIARSLRPHSSQQSQ
jgi:hypothetical protein